MTDKSFQKTVGDKEIAYVDSGREPRCAPNPNFPNGTPVDIAGTATPACRVDLPYPAPRCGRFEIKCNTCGQIIAITVAGRIDDPTSVKWPCKLVKLAN